VLVWYFISETNLGVSPGSDTDEWCDEPWIPHLWNKVSDCSYCTGLLWQKEEVVCIKVSAGCSSLSLVWVGLVAEFRPLRLEKC
jgi:hypothetical protein